MKHLATLNKYFWKYRYRFLLGIIFIIVSNYFRILAPQVTGYIIDAVEKYLPGYKPHALKAGYDPLVKQFIDFTETSNFTFSQKIALCGITLLVLALLGGFF